MFFKTRVECDELVRFLGFNPEDLKKKQTSSFKPAGSIRLAIEEERARSYALAKMLVSWLGAFRGCFLWVTEFGTWPSSENWHLYYRLRTSYGDFRELQVVPGHDFLDYETADLVSFVDLIIQFGWGAHLLPTAGQGSMFISHDGWVRVIPEARQEAIIKDIEAFELLYEFDPDPTLTPEDEN